MSLLDYIAMSTILGGVLTFAIIVARRQPMPAILHGESWLARIYRADQGVPYGIALAAGALMTYPDSVWMAALVG